MNFLITGSGGFVGGHLIKEIKNRIPKANVIGLHRNPINQKINNVKYVKVDLNDLEAVVKTFRLHKPDYVIHLAAESSVNYSWENPANSLENNLNIYLNVLEALRKLNYFPKILSVGSSEVYGAVIKEDLPISENLSLKPLNPYAVFRVAQENISSIYNKSFGFKIIMTRSFNHFGKGQDQRFFIPKLICQILDKKIKNIKLGDLNIVRDYIYIDDVVNAYLELLFEGKINSVYNISNGKGYKLNEILGIIEEISKIKKPIIIDHNLIRPSDNPIIIGDNTKIINETMWSPKVSLKEGLKKVIDDMREVQ